MLILEAATMVMLHVRPPRRTRASSQHRVRRYRKLLLRCLPTRLLALRLLGLAACTCTFFHVLVHVFLSHLLAPSAVRSLRRWPGRNLTWHEGPELDDMDRRTVVVYTYPGLNTAPIDALLSSHPRVLWFDEGQIYRHRRLRRLTSNITAIVNQLFNCSSAALPLMLDLVNQEVAALGQPSWCLPRGRTKKLGPRTSCRKVSRSQIKKFCLQHHVAVKLAEQWKLRNVLNLDSQHLKVLHVLGHPKIVKDEVIQVHFSTKTQQLRQIHRDVVQPIQQKRACQRLKDDVNFLQTELPTANGWYYQRFLPECFAFMPVSCALEMFNFLDIYASDELMTQARRFVNNSEVQSFDIADMSDESSYARLQLIEEDVCTV